MRIFLLPGLDGTGELFAPLRGALARTREAEVVGYPLEQRSADCAEFVRSQLPARDVVLIAESFSGAIALALMAREPGRFRCAVLVAAFAVGPVRWLARLAPLIPASLLEVAWLQHLALDRGCLDGDSEPELLALVRSAVATVPGRTLKDRIAWCARLELRPVLPSVTTPVLYLRAGRDRLVSRASSERLVRALPQCTMQDIDGPHLLLQARPRECAAAIEGFLATHDA